MKNIFRGLITLAGLAMVSLVAYLGTRAFLWVGILLCKTMFGVIDPVAATLIAIFNALICGTMALLVVLVGAKSVKD